MMKFTLAPVTLTLSAHAAVAHPGHLVEAAGHNHWIGLAALGAAVAVAGWAILKGRKDADAEGAAPEDDVAEDEVSADDAPKEA